MCSDGREASQGDTGVLELDYMSFTVAEPGAIVPANMFQPHVEELLWRAKLFLANYCRAQDDQRAAIACLSASLRCSVATKTVVDGLVELGRVPPYPKDGTEKLSYYWVLKHLRNADEHYFPIPSVDGDYLIGLMKLSGTATVQIIGGKPRKWRKDGRIDSNRPIILAVRGPTVVVFDESRNKAVNLAFAVSELILSIDRWLPRVFPANSRAADTG